MKVVQLIKFCACACIIATLSLVTACKKENTGVIASIKCDYSPYALGSKFSFSTASSFVATDTITGDTTINGIGYAKLVATNIVGNGVLAKRTVFIRCDANGIYTLFDKGSLGPTDITNFSGKEFPSLKLPASVGTTWNSDTLKYTASGINFTTFYKMTETALGGSKIENGTTYANNLITLQVRTYTTSILSGVVSVDSSVVTNTVIDKTFGTVEVSQGGAVIKSLKTSFIR